MSERRILACPACDSASVHHNSTATDADADMDRYRCHDCHETFNEGVERTAKRDGDTRRGLAKRLVDADASEVGP